jgi:hypothetical protein
MSWCTQADVLAITGSEVSATSLAVANSVITVYAGRTEDASDVMGARDLNWLKQATAWQARFVENTPGFGLQPDASSLTQDGLTVQTRHEYSGTLAPMAARALKNLSWKADRSVQILRITVPAGQAVTEFVTEAGDAHTQWEPL